MTVAQRHASSAENIRNYKSSNDWSSRRVVHIRHTGALREWLVAPTVILDLAAAVVPSLRRF